MKLDKSLLVSNADLGEDEGSHASICGKTAMGGKPLPSEVKDGGGSEGGNSVPVPRSGEPDCGRVPWEVGVTSKIGEEGLGSSCFFFLTGRGRGRGRLAELATSLAVAPSTMADESATEVMGGGSFDLGGAFGFFGLGFGRKASSSSESVSSMMLRTWLGAFLELRSSPGDVGGGIATGGWVAFGARERILARSAMLGIS